MATKAFAPAKVNLTLHVTGQRSDGYHLLDSLVVFADVGDALSVDEGVGLTLDVTGPMAEGVPTGASNSILKAAAFLGQDDLAFTLEKHLPSAAGIGGGTSDAAAALRAMAKLRDVAMPDDTAALGADVPVCVVGRAARMSGIGEVLNPVEGLPDLHAVLVNPRVGVATPDVFRALSNRCNPPMPDRLPRFDSAKDCAHWLATQRNDLEPPAMAVQPVVADVIAALNATDGALLARMSGSGATCFALCADKDQAQRAATALSAAHPNWWVRACCLS